MSGKDCSRWRRSDCPGDESYRHWQWCTLMNDNAIPRGQRREDYDLAD